jgi:transposase
MVLDCSLPSTPHLLRLTCVSAPLIQALRQTWVFQYYAEEGRLRWRKAEDLPPAGLRFDSPYDPEARFGNKRSITWTGYKVHFTETCEDEEIHLITHVETTAAGVLDSQAITSIQEALAKRTLLPSEHFLDSGYVDADVLVKSQRNLDLEIIGPMRPDSSWQAKTGQGYDLSHFTIDWQTQQVTCPAAASSTPAGSSIWIVVATRSSVRSFQPLIAVAARLVLCVRSQKPSPGT